jgi:hypothetical protein
MVARERRPLREGAAVAVRAVERVDDEVDEVAKPIRHVGGHDRLIAFDVLLDSARPKAHRDAMPSWKDFAEEAPELAEKVRERLDAHRHKTIATVRRDGSPRISAIEAQIVDGELWTGSMWQALKARDLQRDPRFALHSGTDEPSDFKGDAKVAGVAEEITDPALVEKHNGAAASGPSHLFRLDLREVSVVGVDHAANKLVIEVWRPGEGVRRIERA